MARGGCRREFKCPIFSLADCTKNQAGHSTGVMLFLFCFFLLGPHFVPYPPAPLVSPPMTLPQLFPIALSALIVADWLNGKYQNGGAMGRKKVKKKKDGEDL